MLDLKAVRAEEDQVLNSYGWVDQQKGVVRIPIDAAIDLLAQNGSAVAAAPTAGADGVSCPRRAAWAEDAAARRPLGERK